MSKIKKSIRITFGLIFVLLFQNCSQQNQDATNSTSNGSSTALRLVMVTPVLLPINATETNLAPWIDGYMVRVDSADIASGQVATDTTVCTTAPCTQRNNFSTLDTDVQALASLQCGSAIHSVSHKCLISFTLRAVSNPNTYNSETPSWVFGQPWATTVGASAPQDAAFCSNYPQNSSASPLAPPTGTANINTTNCGSGSTACTQATVATGVPAYWEKPFLAYKEGWLQQFFTYLSTASYLSQVSYVSLAIGTGDENTITCATVSGAAGTGLESLVSPPTDEEIRAVHTSAISNYWAFAIAQRQNLGLNFTLVGRFSMGVGLTNKFTDPSWALLEASTPANYSNTGIGSNGWKNGSASSGWGSDLLNYASSLNSCVSEGSSPDCTSNNWSKAMPPVSAKEKLVIAQFCNTSNPAGGTEGCMDSSLSGTGTQAETMGQILSLMATNGVNVLELGSLDAQCFSDVNPQSPCTSGSTIQTTYQSAIQSWASGQSPITY